MGVDPMVSRGEIGTPTQLSEGTGSYKKALAFSVIVKLRVISGNLRFKL